MVTSKNNTITDLNSGGGSRGGHWEVQFRRLLKLGDRGGSPVLDLIYHLKVQEGEVGNLKRGEIQVT